MNVRFSPEARQGIREGGIPIGSVIVHGGKIIGWGHNRRVQNKPTSEQSDIAGATNYVTAALEESMAGKPVAVSASRPYGCSVKYSH